MTTLINHTQAARLGRAIILYELDLTPIGGAVLHVVNAEESRGASVVTFGGIGYAPWPFELGGTDRGLNALEPRPSLNISNLGRFWDGHLFDYGNLIGAKIRRIRTFDTFLDGQPNASTSQTFTPDVYILDKLIHHDDVRIEFECATPLDLERIKLPAQVMTADYCPRIYRRYNPTADVFEYDTSALACPYTRAQSYDKDGIPSDVWGDSASKRLSTCCKPRFGENAPLPFGGYPALGKTRR